MDLIDKLLGLTLSGRDEVEKYISPLTLSSLILFWDLMEEFSSLPFKEVEREVVVFDKPEFEFSDDVVEAYYDGKFFYVEDEPISKKNPLPFGKEYTVWLSRDVLTYELFGYDGWLNISLAYVVEAEFGGKRMGWSYKKKKLPQEDLFAISKLLDEGLVVGDKVFFNPNLLVNYEFIKSWELKEKDIVIKLIDDLRKYGLSLFFMEGKRHRRFFISPFYEINDKELLEWAEDGVIIKPTENGWDIADEFIPGRCEVFFDKGFFVEKFGSFDPLILRREVEERFLNDKKVYVLREGF